jgi:hypothetical protein
MDFVVAICCDSAACGYIWSECSLAVAVRHFNLTRRNIKQSPNCGIIHANLSSAAIAKLYVYIV